MPSLAIEREPNKLCANSNKWRNGNTSVQQRSRPSILDLAKKKNVWIGWKKLTSSRTALVGILRSTRSTTAFATSRVFRRWCRRFFTKHSEDRHLLRRTEAAQCLQGCGSVHRRGLGALPRHRAGLSGLRHSELGNPFDCRAHRCWSAHRACS